MLQPNVIENILSMGCKSDRSAGRRDACLFACAGIYSFRDFRRRGNPRIDSTRSTTFNGTHRESKYRRASASPMMLRRATPYCTSSAVQTSSRRTTLVRLLICQVPQVSRRLSMTMLEVMPCLAVWIREVPSVSSCRERRRP